jgi:hypothetical protein
MPLGLEQLRNAIGRSISMNLSLERKIFQIDPIFIREIHVRKYEVGLNISSRA